MFKLLLIIALLLIIQPSKASANLELPAMGAFELEIIVNDSKHIHMEDVIDKNLEIYIESNMERLTAQSTAGAVIAKRFGAKNDGVYALRTDKAPLPGEFLSLTQGLRLIGNKIFYSHYCPTMKIKKF